MKQPILSALCLSAALTALAGLRSATGQTIAPGTQVSSPQAAATHAAPAAKPAASKPAAPQITAGPTALTPQRFSANGPRAIGQPVMNVRQNYLPMARSFNPPRTLNPTFATLKTQRDADAGDRQPIKLDPTTRQKELRTLAEMRARQRLERQNRTLATINPQRHVRTEVNPQRHLRTDDPANQRQPGEHESPDNKGKKKWHNKKDHRSFADAFRCHWHEWHDRDWWHDHHDTIVFVNTGYYFLDGSYWYPAWGYDPLQTYYDYDGPVYTYGNLLPDEVIANVQTALQDAGYYSGPITGSLSLETRAALANFQRDYGLPITGAIDEPTVEVLGLYQTDDATDFQTDHGY
jgi:Putative peptidoglycan binding domain